MADKGFGVKEINLIGASGTPTIESPNNINLNAVNVAISTNVSIGGTLSVTGNISIGGTLTYEDVTNIDSVGIVTARAGIKVTGGNLDLNNDRKIRLGNSADLVLESNGTNSFIDENGSGKLIIRSGNQIDFTSSSNASMLEMFVGGAVKAYHNGNLKLETTNSGITVTGGIEASGNVNISSNNKLRLGDSAEIQINHLGGNSFIEHTLSTGVFYIQGDTLKLTNTNRDETFISCSDDGKVEVYFNNIPTFETTSSGAALDSQGATTTLQIISDTESSIDFNDHGGSAKRYKIGTNISDNSGQFEIKDMTANVERLRIDTSGRILKGLTTARGNFANNTSGVEYGVQIEGTSAIAAGLSIIRNSNDANDGGIVLGKTRATSNGGNTVVQAGDDLGNITFAGSDGTTLQFGAEIIAEVQSGVGNDDLPTDLIFKTNGGSTSTAERLRIDSSGHMLHGVTSDEDTSGSGGLRFINTGDIQIDGDQKALVFRSTNNTAQIQSAIEWWNENGAGVQSKITCDRTAVSQAPSDLVFYTSANVDTTANNGEGDITERLRITSAGKVGVNCTPTHLFHISESTTLNTGVEPNNPAEFSVAGPNKTLTGGGANAYFSSNDAMAADKGGQISFTGRTTASSTFASNLAVIKGAKENGTSTNVNAYLAFAVSNHNAGALVERLRIASDGKVSMHTAPYNGGGTVPELYVRGSSGRTLKIHNPNAGTSCIQLTNQTTGEGEDKGFFVQQLSSGDAMFTHIPADKDIIFRTSDGGTIGERLRITSGGKLLVGRTSSITIANDPSDACFEQLTDNGMALTIHCNKTNKRGFGIYYPSSSGATDAIRFNIGSAAKFLVIHNGNCQNANNSYGSISDASLKENIVDAKSQWNDIKNIKIRNFNFKESTGQETHTQIGVVAQELETVCPKLVDSSGKDGIKTVASTVLYMKAVKALQEAMTRIESLEAEVAAFKSS